MTLPAEEVTLTPDAAMLELKELQKIPSEDQTDEQIRRGIALCRVIRRTTAGPAAPKTPKSKAAKYAAMDLDDLFKVD